MYVREHLTPCYPTKEPRPVSGPWTFETWLVPAEMCSNRKAYNRFFFFNFVHENIKYLVLCFIQKPYWDTIFNILGWINIFKKFFIVVWSHSHVRLFATPWTAALQASLSFTNSWSLLKPHIHWVSDAIQPSNLLSSPSPPAFNLSQHEGLFQWVVSSYQVAKVLELQL